MPSEPKTPQRKTFDSALKVLLIIENLEGTKWAIQQLRDAAGESNAPLCDHLDALADRLDGMLDVRAAMLTVGD